MVKLEDLKPDMCLHGLVPNQIVTLLTVKRFGDDAVNVVYRGDDDKLGDRLLYREDETKLEEIVQDEQMWPFDGDGKSFRMVSEAYRIHLAHLFDPLLAVHTSLIEPLPHQITAVYDEMLTRHPLRFLLADDPGAGKTVMAGMLIRELIARGDVRRCLICVPGNLTAQWQDELWNKFQLNFIIVTRDMIKASGNRNPFKEHAQLIVRLDQAKKEDIQERLGQTNWDLIVCDEAHKMSAHFWRNKLEETQRYKLGKLLSKRTRHFLLMTATPHNGREEDFQLFLKLLDAGRFDERFRHGIHRVNASDLMRRMVKEKLRTLDGKTLFPERKAYTVHYDLSDEEDILYKDVTEYIRNEFNLAERLESGKRRNTVGFAMTVLQRRLASSPAAIHQSLKRRRERLENQLKEARNARRRALKEEGPQFDEDDWEDFEDLLASEREEIEAEILNAATAALSLQELQTEIIRLRELETQADCVRRSGNDRKWEELRKLFGTPEMQNADGTQRKLVIFTEHLDTLNYLINKLNTLFGRSEVIVTIHGGIRPEGRRVIEDRFRNGPEALILVATDAAGEGINLQCAHLMVNYDLPWNPNRLEQRFGRIHRIGQTEVCHLWNLVAGETREGRVYRRLLGKLETMRGALIGDVFDVLGELFQETPLRDLLKEAVRYGNNPEVRARLEQAIDNATEQERVRELMENRALVTDNIDTSQIIRIRTDMERAGAQRLQPYYVKAFFLQAFRHLSATLRELKREPGRYAIDHVPAELRNHAKGQGMAVVQNEYHRICFEKNRIQLSSKPDAELLCPGHPLLDAIISLILQQEREILKRGAMLVDENDPGIKLRVLFYLEQAIHDARPSRESERQAISREIHFVEIDNAGNVRETKGTPYLDYRPATLADKVQVEVLREDDWLKGEKLEKRAIKYAIEHLVPRHLERVRRRRFELIDKTEAAVRERMKDLQELFEQLRQEQRELVEEQRGYSLQGWIEELEHRQQYQQLERQELLERNRRELIEQIHLQEQFEELEHREQLERQEKLEQNRRELLELKEAEKQLERRRQELEWERQISATQPIVKGGALIIPIGLLLGEQNAPQLQDRLVTEKIAMRAVMQAETTLGNQPEDMSKRNLGYDIESRNGNGELRFIEVKGRRAGAETVTLTRNELMTALNCGEKYIMALVEVEGETARQPHYLRGYAFHEPNFTVSSFDFKLKELLAQSEAPN